MRTKWIQALFVIAAAYDGLLGLVFLFASDAPFRWFGVTPPNHPGYVQFPAALLLIFAVMFLTIAGAPAKNAGLIPYGILLKASYCGVILYHRLGAGLPDMWMPFCAIDLAFFGLFLLAWRSLRSATDST